MARRSAAVSVRPVLDEVIEAHGGDRADWEWVCDRAALFRHDDGVQHALECMARRDELNRKLGVTDIAVARARGRGPLSRRFGGGSRPLASKFRGLFIDGGTSATRDSWFDASRYADDTTVVTDWLDYVDAAHVATQGTGALRVPIPAAHADFAGAVCGTFTAHNYVSTRAAGDWTPWHSGSGCEQIHVFTPTAVVAATTYVVAGTHATGAITTVGHRVGWFTSVQTNYVIGNGTINNTIGTAGVAVNVNVATYYDWSLTGTTMVVRRKSTQQATPTVSGSLSSSAPTNSMTIGASGGGTGPASMRWRASYFFRRVLTAVERSVAQQWIQRDTGIVP